MPDKSRTMPLTDVLNAADAAIVAEAPPVRHPAAEEPNPAGDFDTGPLNRAEMDGTVQEPDPAFQAGDHVTVTFTNGEVSDVHKSEPRTAPIDELVTLSGQLAVEFGTTNEFSQRRIASLREELEELIGDVKLIDAQLEHLNKRRTDAMLACSGISADLRALGDMD